MMGRRKLRRNQLLEIIELYKQNECLWNASNPSYKRNDLKLEAYIEIAKQMGIPVEDTKKKIRNLRNTYIIEHKKILKDPNYKPQLFWYDEMQFINPTIILRKSVGQENAILHDAETSNTKPSIEHYNQSEESSELDSSICIPSDKDEAKAFANWVAVALGTLPEDLFLKGVQSIQFTIMNLKKVAMKRRVVHPTNRMKTMPTEQLFFTDDIKSQRVFDSADEEYNELDEVDVCGSNTKYDYSSNYK